jgi:hypothetical protein
MSKSKKETGISRSKTFGPKRTEEGAGLRKLHETFHNLLMIFA